MRKVHWCFLHSDIFHIPSSNLILTLQEKYYANKTLKQRKQKHDALSNTLAVEEGEKNLKSLNRQIK